MRVTLAFTYFLKMFGSSALIALKRLDLTAIVRIISILLLRRSRKLSLPQFGLFSLYFTNKTKIVIGA